ncbi:DUF4189 domain-containing protein [Dyella sp.]|uniref:DUF4189 domain-containing protein n=1 Tax=Dyella sp. TaxID=1869338 RepID=UPI0039C8747B
MWVSSWGAIATDKAKGLLSTASGNSSQGAAELSALTECRSKGGDACKIDLS